VGAVAGAGWYDTGATATVSVSESTVTSAAGSRQVFVGWGGDATGTGIASDSITMDSAKTATANWKTQYQVTYATSASVLQVAVPSAEWVDSGAPATGVFTPSVTDSAGSTRSIFISDDRPSSVKKATLVTAIYQSQYLVTFNQTGITYKGKGVVVTISGEEKTYDQLPVIIWVNSGDSIAFNYAEKVDSTDIGSQFILVGTSVASPQVINGPMIIQADYKSEGSINLSTILISAAALAIPPLVVIPMLKMRGRTKRITPIAIGGGSISPGTVQKIERGGSSTVFIITANPGYRIGDVIVDKAVHLGPVRTYKFLKVEEDHTLSAIFYED
jgi:uncharacterized repeat protein (TIGR02543 family)